MKQERSQEPDRTTKPMRPASQNGRNTPPGWWKRLRQWIHEYPIRAAGAGLGAGAIIFLGLNFVPLRFFTDFAANIATEMASIAVTVLFIDYLNERRQNEQLKAQLIREMGASDNGIAHRAVRELRAYGWLTDGSLQGADLTQANLQGVNLWGANLQEATLLGAILEEADLSWANLQGASLAKANLMGANLSDADLQGALFWWADLTNADLTMADLQGAILEQANLRGARLYSAKNTTEKQLSQAAFLDGATLPDGSNYEGEEDV